ncbi:MAG: hypothetical protein ACAF41_12095 [Leptolyngbya sp. BL-A-14]
MIAIVRRGAIVQILSEIQVLVFLLLTFAVSAAKSVNSALTVSFSRLHHNDYSAIAQF